jgi:raffinose/stachyose/melibiose transport system permease protein
MKGQEISLRQARNHLSIYLFLLPCVLFIGLFSYYPFINGVYHSVFRWNGGDVDDFHGLQGYSQLFFDDPGFWLAFKNALILGLANVFKMAPSILTAVCLHRVRNARLQFAYRIAFVIPMVIPILVTTYLWKAIYDPSNGALNTLLQSTGMMKVLVWLSSSAAGIADNFDPLGFFSWLGALFRPGENPAWLGTPSLALLALILRDFPWVGTFGVLVYLAVLQSIPREIYEAAEVDGAGWFSKFRYIELPMILRQVRIMVILVIIGSINDAGLVMAMFGIEGGPGGVVQMPALFMYREAFQNQKLGYACAIGVVLFSVILICTKLNEWLVKPGENA